MLPPKKHRAGSGHEFFNTLTVNKMHDHKQQPSIVVRVFQGLLLVVTLFTLFWLFFRGG